MNCPVCNRNNAVTLSICPSCGAMIHDSVREELVTKISNVAKPLDFKLKENKMIPNKNFESAKTTAPSKTTTEPKTNAPQITTKTTSPTLVEFHSKNATIPEWRLQLQNVVRQRQERETAEAEIETPAIPQLAKLITNGATALKAETAPEPQTLHHKNPTLNSALERIEKSRRRFLEEEKPLVAPTAVPAKANKNYPFYIAAKTIDAAPKPAEVNPSINAFAKPKLASTTLKTEPGKLDTNKLPPLSRVLPADVIFESQPVIDIDETAFEEKIQTKIEITEVIKTEIELTATTETVEAEETDEFEDCAPLAMRFNAGFFDLIIGSFASLLLLAPFMLFGGNWLSIAGIFAFLATCAIVMFVYLTAAIGLYGRTFGMRLFSLEIIDVENEDYPTLHQAAVNSAVYLLSLTLGGIGFLTLPFNEDKRAVHDLVAGTVMIKE